MEWNRSLRARPLMPNRYASLTQTERVVDVGAPIGGLPGTWLVWKE
jgi:hypothetical protein